MIDNEWSSPRLVLARIDWREVCTHGAECFALEERVEFPVMLRSGDLHFYRSQYVRLLQRAPMQ